VIVRKKTQTTKPRQQVESLDGIFFLCRGLRTASATLSPSIVSQDNGKEMSAGLRLFALATTFGNKQQATAQDRDTAAQSSRIELGGWH
jgi:hypothetical protein